MHRIQSQHGPISTALLHFLRHRCWRWRHAIFDEPLPLLLHGLIAKDQVAVAKAGITYHLIAQVRTVGRRINSAAPQSLPVGAEACSGPCGRGEMTTRPVSCRQKKKQTEGEERGSGGHSREWRALVVGSTPKSLPRPSPRKCSSAAEPSPAPVDQIF